MDDRRDEGGWVILYFIFEWILSLNLFKFLKMLSKEIWGILKCYLFVFFYI